MKNKLRLLASSMVILAAQSSIANADGLTDLNLCPYIGADVAWRHQNFSNNLGGNTVRRNFPQGDIYLGVKFNEFVGVQVGFEGTTSRHKSTTFSGPYTLFGQSINPNIDSNGDPIANGFDQFSTSSRIYGGHADLVGFYPFCFCDEQFNLIGSVGIARKHFKLNYTPYVESGTPLIASDIQAFSRQFVSKKYVARLGLGIQYMLTDCAGFRVIGGWENTSRFKNIRSRTSTSPFVAKLQNATTLGIGIFYNF